jgi:hypothetical protein
MVMRKATVRDVRAVVDPSSLFREVNERVLEVNQRSSRDLLLEEWICECGDGSCTERIQLSQDEFERARLTRGWFVVAPAGAHVSPRRERLVERHARYWVIEKAGWREDLARPDF